MKINTDLKILPPHSAGLKPAELDALLPRCSEQNTNEADRHEARERVFTAFMRFAVKLTLGIFKDETLMTVTESTSIAFDSLWKATGEFSLSFGVRFATYAAKVIQRDLRAARRSKIRDQRRHVSMHDLIPDEEGEEAWPKGMDIHRDPWEEIQIADAHSDAVDFLLSLRLRDNQRRLIMHFMECNGNLAEIARRENVSRERIRQVWKELKTYIRTKMEAKGLHIELDLIPKV